MAPVSTSPRPATDEAWALRTEGLTRDYGGGTGLFDVSVTVPRGSVYGLVGPNGAGKTTLLSVVAGVRRADRGKVHLGVAPRRIAVCPDVFEFDGRLTAFEVVDLARSHTARGHDPDAVRRALARTGLVDHARRRVGGFSRGMVQRLGLAAAVVGEPELLVLDEPTSALDPAGRDDVLGLVAGLRGRCTVIFSSQVLADVRRAADHVGVLRAGRLLHEGSTQDLVDTLRPRWRVRLRGPAVPVAAAFEAQAWVERATAEHDAVVVDAVTPEAGERGIPAVIAAAGVRMVSCVPVEADLESALLALTRAGR